MITTDKSIMQVSIELKHDEYLSGWMRYVAKCVSYLQGILWGQKAAAEFPQPVSEALEAWSFPGTHVW